MHQLIIIIVYNSSEKGALRHAKEILDNRLVGEEGQPFDYGTFFDDDSSSMSGKSRFGNRPVVTLADSEEGKKLIDDGMKYTKDNFLKCIKKIREAVKEYTDEELFEEELLDTKKKILKVLDNKNKRPSELGFFKYYCGSVGEQRGSHILLYDNDGEGIDKTSNLKKVLNKWGKKDNSKVYAVPVDVHY